MSKSVDPELVSRIEAVERSVERLQAMVQNMNKHLGQVTIRANEGDRLSLEIAKAFEFSLMDAQEMRRDLGSVKENIN